MISPYQKSSVLGSYPVLLSAPNDTNLFEGRRYIQGCCRGDENWQLKARALFFEEVFTKEKDNFYNSIHKGSEKRADLTP